MNFEHEFPILDKYIRIMNLFTLGVTYSHITREIRIK